MAILDFDGCLPSLLLIGLGTRLWALALVLFIFVLLASGAYTGLPGIDLQAIGCCLPVCSDLGADLQSAAGLPRSA